MTENSDNGNKMKRQKAHKEARPETGRETVEPKLPKSVKEDKRKRIMDLRLMTGK